MKTLVSLLLLFFICLTSASAAMHTPSQFGYKCGVPDGHDWLLAHKPFPTQRELLRRAQKEGKGIGVRQSAERAEFVEAYVRGFRVGFSGKVYVSPELGRRKVTRVR